MNHGSSYHPYDDIDNSHYPTISNETLHGVPIHNAQYGHCPVMSRMNTVSPDPLFATNTGPFVAMHLSYYLSLIRQLGGPVQPSGPVTEHLSGPSTSAVEAEVIRMIDIQSRDGQAPERAAMKVLATTEGGGQPRKPQGKRSKVACCPCSDAHKICDQGRPCGRCTKRGIDASCVHPPTKGGRRARKVIIAGEQPAGMPSAALPCFTNPSTLSTVPLVFDMFENSMVGSYTGNSV